MGINNLSQSKKIQTLQGTLNTQLCKTFLKVLVKDDVTQDSQVSQI